MQKHLIAIIQPSLMILLVLLTFWPALQGQFIWDDDRYVYLNPLVNAPEGIFSIWSSLQKEVNYWPVSNSLFWLQNRLWGNNPMGFHLVNVLLHAANTLLLISILKKISYAQALLAGLMFAIHPLNVETVAWVSELKNLIAMHAYLWSIWFYLQDINKPGWKYTFLSLLFCGSALLAKTAACALPITISLFAWYFYIKNPGKSAQNQDHHLIKLIPYYVLAFSAVVGFLILENEQQQQLLFTQKFSIWERLWIACSSLPFYFYKFLFPFPLLTLYPFEPWAGTGFQLVWVSLLLLIMFILCVYLWRKRAIILSLVFLYILTNLLPVLGLIPHMMLENTYVTDHYSYFALPGIIILGLMGLDYLDKKWLNRSVGSVKQAKFPLWQRLFSMQSPILTAGLILVLGTWIYLSFQQTKIYQNNSTLWNHTLKYYPASSFAHFSLGAEYLQQRKLAIAKEQFDESLRLRPDFALSYLNRGYVYLHLQQLEQAYQDFNHALQIQPHHALAWNNRGLIKRLQGDYQGALSDLNQAIVIAPEQAQFYLNRAQTYSVLGEALKARQDLESTIRLQPKSQQAWKEMLQWQREANDIEGMLQSLSQLIPLQPQDAGLLNLRVTLFIQTEQWEKAALDIEKALGQKPNLAAIWVNRGIIYFEHFKQNKIACENWHNACALGACETITEALKNKDCEN